MSCDLRLAALAVVIATSLSFTSNVHAAVCPLPPPLTTTDTDSDLYDDSIDLFPTAPLRHYVYDLDGIANFDYTDDENDGVP
ncbi:MAG: hypothetical protein HRT52_16425, partial [Colwellia sp.]|nr:hypothetical protein [Colwellia sp.]